MLQPLFKPLAALLLLTANAFAQAPIPYNQSEPPGPPLSPEEAIKRMTVPPGFVVELVASEPDIVNPTAMTFDARGRAWICESVEYPKREAGAGKDRIKILEDTDGDGKADKFTVFADGLNIPSGICIGLDGVWVANAPDLLLLKDTDGDDKADSREVVLTGFGRTDTHELPNSLSWGPDGWLYGLNGCFNVCRVEHQGKTHTFAGAIFRVHPKTREFELFAEGLSNPWGIAWDDDGSAFLSACVIDHLWHLTESAHYISQSFSYRPFTWPVESIVKHKHQKAAYCGLEYYDSDAYPEQFRKKLYMGNIHGNCINCDWLTRDGSTYFAKPDPDFLSANNAWFMPVSQKTGPDGCLYVLDWYDQFHCYQDAMREPESLDRLKGRLYRIRWKETPRAETVNLSAETDDQLIARLASGNGYHRKSAMQLLWQRGDKETKKKLEALALDSSKNRRERLLALYAIVSMEPLDEAFCLKLIDEKDPAFRAWAVRASGNAKSVSPTIETKLISLISDPSPDVRLQLAIAAPKCLEKQSVELLLKILAESGDDKLLPKIAWRNLHPLMEERADELLAEMRSLDVKGNARLTEILPRVIDRILGRLKPDVKLIADLTAMTAEGKNANPAALSRCLSAIAAKTQNRELAGAELAQTQAQLGRIVSMSLFGERSSPAFASAVQLATSWRRPEGITVAAGIVKSDADESLRLKAFEALAAVDDEKLFQMLPVLLAPSPENSSTLRRGMLNALARASDPKVGEIVLNAYDRLEPELRPPAIELLTGRPAWSKNLISAVRAKKIPDTAVNLNQVRKLALSSDPEVVKSSREIWGTVRQGQNLNRLTTILQMRTFLSEASGDPHRGQEVFKRVCGQCHKLHGEGADVGPDITVNGRSSFEQLLSNVFDPSLVIGPAYQAHNVVTSDGRVLVGLLTEETDARIVLKVQGGKLETIPKNEIDHREASNQSMMPEGLEKQLKPEELRDLFALLMLDKPPGDPAAKRLPLVEKPPK